MTHIHTYTHTGTEVQTETSQHTRIGGVMSDWGVKDSPSTGSDNEKKKKRDATDKTRGAVR